MEETPKDSVIPPNTTFAIEKERAKTTIALINSIHGTCVNVRVYEGILTKLEYHTVNRIRNTLCKVEGCQKCNTPLCQVGETNPKVIEKGGEIFILSGDDTSLSENTKTEDLEEIEETKKKRKTKSGDKTDIEYEANRIHFTELESIIAINGELNIEERVKLFNIIRKIRNEQREELGLNAI